MDACVRKSAGIPAGGAIVAAFGPRLLPGRGEARGQRDRCRCAPGGHRHRDPSHAGRLHRRGGRGDLVSKADGHIYYYDVNATSNFVANAPDVVGFDPTARFVNYIVRAAQGGSKQLAA